MRILIYGASLVIGARALAPSGDYLAQLGTAPTVTGSVGARLPALVVEDPLQEAGGEAPVVPALTGLAEEKAAGVQTAEAKLALLAEGVKILEGKAAEQAAREEAWRAASVANLERLRVAEEKAAEVKAEQVALLAAEEAKLALRSERVQILEVKAAEQAAREEVATEAPVVPALTGIVDDRLSALVVEDPRLETVDPPVVPASTGIIGVDTVVVRSARLYAVITA